MGNCIPTLRCKDGNKVRDVWFDETATEKTKDLPRETVVQKTGTKRCIKITVTKKQLEMLLNAEGVSFKLPETCKSGKRRWKPSLQTIVEENGDSSKTKGIQTPFDGRNHAPRFLDILAYFWPLFASTAAFLAVAITFGGFQQLSEEATGEGIMEYVAGRPDDSHKYD
ncbi:unnamed protein product [Eruca vesicaria subsp. sativa]|uniref:Uncharacterized protein n=1 Tax=Eruca vesicaria subsp. sativa TaxID=29727 RepID=A0ABC8KZR8_ERUVS|nr:unnamed protein product [Eruca vesicaria subsp. sativa]